VKQISEQGTTKDQLPSPDEEAWDDYEEDGPMDLENQLDAALDRAFGATKCV
jgi:hypothetical protein